MTLDEGEAFKFAEAYCAEQLLPALPLAAKWEPRFRESLALQVAGYVLRAGDELPRDQWLAATLGMSTLEVEIEGWNALLRHRYRVAMALLRLVVESALYMQGCAVLPDLVESWFTAHLGPGTVGKILTALRPKLGEKWTAALKSNWDTLNELAHSNLFPTLIISVDALSHQRRTVLGLPLGGGVVKDDVARALCQVYAAIARDTLIAQMLCVVAPRDRYPQWHERFERFLEQPGDV